MKNKLGFGGKRIRVNKVLDKKFQSKMKEDECSREVIKVVTEMKYKEKKVKGGG